MDDGDQKYEMATAALGSLRKQVAPYIKLRTDAERAARRRERERIQAQADGAVQQELALLKVEFYRILQLDSQARGYALEKLLNRLFNLFEFESRASFKIIGEQIDGAFTYGGTEYIVEARWRDGLIAGAELDAFEGKVGRKLDNTLGLFISMNGFHDRHIATFQPTFDVDSYDRRRFARGYRRPDQLASLAHTKAPACGPYRGDSRRGV